MITATILFLAMCFVQLIYYLQQTSNLNLLNYDISTCTAADYTVEMDIPKEMYNDFENNVWPRVQDQENVEGRKISKAFAMKKHMSVEISRILTDFSRVRRSHEAAHSEGFEMKENPAGRRSTKKAIAEDFEVRIANIEFAFENYELIDLLKKRGTAITALQFDKIKEFDEEIN